MEGFLFIATLLGVLLIVAVGRGTTPRAAKNQPWQPSADFAQAASELKLDHAPAVPWLGGSSVVPWT